MDLDGSGSKKLLAIDVGNTNTVIGVFRGDILSARWRIATDSRRMADEYAALFQSLFGLNGIMSGDIAGCILCSVVPPAQLMLQAALQTYWDIDPVVVSSTLDIGIEILYSPRQAVGADRIANAIATVRYYGTPAIVVDFGTATTFDAISSTGAYIGGAIAPGLEVSEEALFSRTAQLPRVPLQVPISAIGENTVMSLQSGLLYGHAGLVDGLVARMSEELGPGVRVIATGGLAKVIAPLTSSVQHVDVDLTLNGLYLLYHRALAHADAAGIRQDQSLA